MKKKMSEKVIVRTQRKDVRRINFSQGQTLNNTQQNFDLYTADGKETLMGMDLEVNVHGKSGLANDGAAHNWHIIIDPEDASPSVPLGDFLDNEVKREEIEFHREIICISRQYRYEIKNKKKRKLSKGDVIKLSTKASVTEAATNNLVISGTLYIGS